MSGWEWFRGEYASWAEARAAATGYDDPNILDRVLGATRRVVVGTAAFERDGFAFERPFVNGPLLRALKAAASRENGSLRVLDFGGALGSAYWQHRSALSEVERLEWLVVEQPHYVAAGRAELEDGRLRFVDRLPDASVAPPDLVVASSSLQYLESPWRTLEALLDLRAAWLFLDRIPLLPEAPDRLTVEHVPPELGETSYPAWFLSENRFHETLRRAHDVVEAFETTLEDGNVEQWQVFGQIVPNRGFLFRRQAEPARAD